MGINVTFSYISTKPNLTNKQIIFSEVNTGTNRWPPTDHFDIGQEWPRDGLYLTDLFSIRCALMLAAPGIPR